MRTAFLFLLLSLICAIESYAQDNRITGRLSDEKKQPIVFATVALLKATDSTLVGTTLTDSTGTFKLASPAAGTYVLRFTAIGYPLLKSDIIESTGPDDNKDIGDFVLNSSNKQLSNVTVTSLRPTITQLADRMVVSVEGTAMAAGNNAFTVLSKSPGVFVDADGNIQLNGRTGVTVMIDNRLTYLSARDLRNMLEAMPAENIKNIEIITNPSSRFDAAGTSGILNINLKKNTKQGMNGSIYSSYVTNLKQNAFVFGGNVNYKLGKWNSFLSVDRANRVGGREATFTRVFNAANNSVYFDQVANADFEVTAQPTIRIGTDYSINSNHIIGIMLNRISSKVYEEFFTDTDLGNAPHSPTQKIRAENYINNRHRNYTSNLSYSGKLDTVGTTLAADFYYVTIKNRGFSDFFNYFTEVATGELTTEKLHTTTPNEYDIYSGKIDLVKPIKKGRIEAGLKHSTVISDNDFRFYFNNSGLVIDPLRTNHFKYRESIGAAYINWGGPLNKKITIQAGLRVEQTRSVGTSFTTGQVTKRNYTDLFPSVFIQQKVHENYGINFNYSRRLTRPNYGNLNPFRSYRDPYTWTEGNPFLRPQYTHSFSVAQNFKKIYILQVNYQLTKDVITEIPQPDAATSTTVYTTGNVNDGQSLAVLGIVPIKVMKWWDAQNTLQVYYNKFTSMFDRQEVTNDQVTFLFQSLNTMVLPKDWRFEFTLLYRGPTASGLYQMAAIKRVDAAIRKSLFKKKVDLSLNVSDIFKSQRLIWAANYNGNINEFDQYLRFRVFNFTVRYNFSKGIKVNTKNRNSSLDELNRAN